MNPSLHGHSVSSCHKSGFSYRLLSPCSPGDSMKILWYQVQASENGQISVSYWISLQVNITGTLLSVLPFVLVGRSRIEMEMSPGNSSFSVRTILTPSSSGSQLARKGHQEFPSFGVNPMLTTSVHFCVSNSPSCQGLTKEHTCLTISHAILSFPVIPAFI